MLLEEYQQLILSRDAEEEYAKNQLTVEQEKNYQELISLKDEEINLLKEDKSKKEQMIIGLNLKI